MNNMPEPAISKNDLVMYIRELFRLEYKKSALKDAQDNLIKEINDLGDLKYDYKPQVEHVEKPAVPSDKPRFKEYNRYGRLSWIVIFILSIVGGCYILAPIVPDEQMHIYAYGILAFSIVFSIIISIVITRAVAKVKHKEEIKNYNEELKNYDLKLNKAQDKYNKAIEKWEDSCKRIDEQNRNRAFNRNCKSALYNQLGKAIVEAEGALKQLYDYNIIHQQYRTYNAIGNILCYFESGRVDTLKEALNKYDDDVFRGIVLTSLDEISFKQEMTYTAIRENNMIVQNAINGVNSIAIQNNKMLNYQQIATENSKAILDSVKNLEFRQTIDMLDRLSSK